jgi:hypothetical protein
MTMRNASQARAAGFLALLAVAAVCPAVAGTPTSTECTEAAEFIGNAAHARENGMTRNAFIGQMESDFTMIRAFPNELRWFVHDEADEAFLLDAAQEVFDRPESPDHHRIAFFRACLSRLMV